ncbi:MFS transporter [Gordonia sp. ABSL1-1]|uniref:MFS transporter n=1 Tax=Gordonia sp. ABSL1-1 TaxID=3053923 RepID=UPI002572B1EB|nr:MFS transporter [Gordonia sp. ABSL1-1]MDL9935724.1 MFS transporter [Gordonia sp. ABSL1-1]
MNFANRTAPIAAGTVVVLSALYFAQGLPFGFFTQAVPVILRRSGFGLTEISATGVLFAPWALKFIWAPFVDRYGTRRQWLLWMQFGSAAVALGLACLNLSSTLTWLFIGIAVVNLLSATQDVATDGLAVQLLAPSQRGVGNGIQVGAYRIGMIVGGGGLLWLLSLAGWRAMFVAMAALMLLATVPVWWMRAGTSIRGARRDRGDGSVRETASEWLRRLRRPGMVAFILIIGAFKFGDSMGSAHVGSFMVDAGLTDGQIALVKGALSSVGALGGAAIGGWLAYRFGRRNALLYGGIAQTLSLGLYVVCAAGAGGFGLIVVASLAEHILGGAATVAVFTLMMDATQADHAGSDYTLAACAVVIVQGVAGVVGGIVGDLFGFGALFAASAVLSAVGCAVLVAGLDRGVGPAEIRRYARAVGENAPNS